MFFDSDDFTNRMLRKASKGTSLSKLQMPAIELRPFEEFTDEELEALPVGTPLIYDAETFRNYFCVSFKCPERGKVVTFERSQDSDFDGNKLRWMMFKFCTVGFNSLVYDAVMSFAAAAGLTCAELKRVSDAIILQNMRPRDIQREFGIRIPFDVLNQIDLIEVAPLEGSLKLYAARLQAPRLQDLPFDPDTNLTKEQAKIVLHYNVNDLDNTILLYNELLPEIKLRERLGQEYNQDLRSKSDAQIAEAVITSELAKLTGRYPAKAPEDAGAVQYRAPAWVGYVSPALRAAVDAVEAARFHLDGNGSPVWPDGLGEREGRSEAYSLKVKIGSTVYKLGMGGLHSQESCVSHVVDEDTYLIDRDVASFYPRIILNERLYPKHLGTAFLDVYGGLVDKRLAAKNAGDKTTANALKITINGGFGKFGNKYSRLYSPDLLLQVTLTGQLALLMLIEMVEFHGIPVVSGNTDGIVIKCPKSRYEDLNAVIALWEQITGFQTEETRYAGTYCRDVNNYYACKDLTDETDDDKAKRLKEKNISRSLRHQS
jgi:DNA polymerase elongation subunit (family B)